MKTAVTEFPEVIFQGEFLCHKEMATSHSSNRMYYSCQSFITPVSLENIVYDDLEKKFFAVNPIFSDSVSRKIKASIISGTRKNKIKSNDDDDDIVPSPVHTTKENKSSQKEGTTVKEEKSSSEMYAKIYSNM